MQGIIFNALEEFVLEQAGIEAWNDVIDKSQVPNGGAYTFGVNYDDAEIVALATTLCEKLGLSLGDGLRAFGAYLFKYLIERGPVTVTQYQDTQSLLKDLEAVIHKDVKRIHPDAYTPFFEYSEWDAQSGKLTYRSKRKLCQVAEGLVAGAAKHYGQSAKMEHVQCMHDGHETCIWKIQFNDTAV